MRVLLKLQPCVAVMQCNAMLPFQCKTQYVLLYVHQQKVLKTPENAARCTYRGYLHLLPHS